MTNRLREWFPQADEETLAVAASLWEQARDLAPDLDEGSRYALMANLAEEARMCGDVQVDHLWREIQRKRGREAVARG